MIETISLYRAPTTVADATGIAEFLRNRVDATVDVRDRFTATRRDDGIAEEFAKCRVLSPHDPETGNSMLGIVRYEERALDHPERAGGVIYDGLQAQELLGERIPAEERDLDHLHLVLTSRVLGTWGDHDGRWHKRVNVLGQPALLSVPGLYEAPAKPEAYYKAQQKHAMLSGDSPPREILEEQVEGEFLIEDDPRTTDVLKGYALQAVHYLATGEDFCEEAHCRLHNPHRQPGVIESQLREPEFCDSHADLYGIEE